MLVHIGKWLSGLGLALSLWRWLMEKPSVLVTPGERQVPGGLPTLTSKDSMENLDGLTIIFLHFFLCV